MPRSTCPNHACLCELSEPICQGGQQGLELLWDTWSRNLVPSFASPPLSCPQTVPSGTEAPACVKDEDRGAQGRSLEKTEIAPH